MTAPVYEQLLTVQDLDLSLLQLRHKHKNHALRSELVVIDEATAAHQLVADEVGERRSLLDRQQAELDAEVSTIETRRAEIETKLYDGSVTGTKDLLALQDEAKMLKERQVSVEDDELEIMEAVELLEAELEPTDAEIRGCVASRAEHEVLLETALGEIDAEVLRLEGERTGAVDPIPLDLLHQYEALRDDLGGVAVARLVGSTCDGCHMSLSAVAFDQIKRQDDDAVLNCDQCGRLLVR